MRRANLWSRPEARSRSHQVVCLVNSFQYLEAFVGLRVRCTPTAGAAQPGRPLRSLGCAACGNVAPPRFGTGGRHRSTLARPRARQAAAAAGTNERSVCAQASSQQCSGLATSCTIAVDSDHACSQQAPSRRARLDPLSCAVGERPRVRCAPHSESSAGNLLLAVDLAGWSAVSRWGFDGPFSRPPSGTRFRGRRGQPLAAPLRHAPLPVTLPRSQ
ncbi:MAG: hypothetical protein RL685_6835 [Pseudomonadota bacterium]|jgi:hypothetical protein